MYLSFVWVMNLTLDRLSDPRVETWPLMGSPGPILCVLAVYMYFVKVWGPRWMAERPAFRLSGLLIVYNVLMVLLSTLFFVVGGRLTYLPGGHYDLVCEPVDYSSRPPATQILRVGWWFLLLKLVELLDTVFFVLRKKQTHVSALHVTHHSLVAWGVWIGLKFGGGGHSSFFPILNCAVHILMYTYYLLAALGPAVRRFLWWKRYLTLLQMAQFIVAAVHACLPLFFDCGYQPFFAYTLLAHAALFQAMFYNFYSNSYFSKSTPLSHPSHLSSNSSSSPSSSSCSPTDHRSHILRHLSDPVRTLD